MEGGFLRGAFSVGALKALREMGLRSVDHATGSSGGIGVLAYYVSGQFEQGINIMPNELPNPKFINLKRFFHALFYKAHLMDVDYLIDTVFKKKAPLSENKIRNSRIRFFVPLTNANNDGGSYFDNHTYTKNTDVDFFEILRASMAVPLMYNKTITINNEEYFDGAFFDTLPLGIPEIRDSKKIIILTKPDDINVISYWLKAGIRLFSYRMSRQIRKSYFAHNKRISEFYKKCFELEKQGNTLLIKPKRIFHTFNNNKKVIEDVIECGYRETLNNQKAKDFLASLTEKDRKGCLMEPV